MPRRRSLLVLLVASVVLAPACSDDSSTADGGDGDDGAVELTAAEQELADAFAGEFADEEDGLGVTADEGACMARVLMAELGAAPFEEAGVTAADLGGDETPGQLLGEGAVNQAQADAIYTGWEGCADLVTAFADSFQAGYEADDATRACFQSGLEEDDLLREYVIASFTKDEELSAEEPPLSAVISLIATCTSSGGDASTDVLVDSIASSLAASGSVTADEARCLAESILETVGADALRQSADDGDFSDATPEVQQAIVDALATAATTCDVPLSKLGRG